MASVNIPGNGACYLGGRFSLRSRGRDHVGRHSGSNGTMTHPPLMARAAETVAGGRPAHDEWRWLAWGRSAFAVPIVLLLIALGVANIQIRARWHEVEDGVLWGQR